MRNPRDFGKPLAIGAPEPPSGIPFKPSRMIHFLDFSNEKMVAKAPEIAPSVDILLGNLEDAVPVYRKEAAREPGAPAIPRLLGRPPPSPGSPVRDRPPWLDARADPEPDASREAGPTLPYQGDHTPRRV